MPRRKLWSLLTKKQRSHLRKMGVRNLAGWDRTRQAQLKWEEPDPETGWVSMACWDCREIAQRLERLS